MRGVEEGRPIVPGDLSEHEGVGADETVVAARSLSTPISLFHRVLILFEVWLTASFGRVILRCERQLLSRHCYSQVRKCVVRRLKYKERR